MAHWLDGITVSAATNDPERGCGQKKEDSFYLEAERREDGTLRAWTWLLPGMGREPIYSTFPPRSHTIIDLDATLANRSVIVWGTPAKTGEWLPDVPALGDHVGETFYTPWSFYKEIRQYGPSRRVSSVQAMTFSELLANYGKVLIAFEAKLPVVKDRKTAEQLRALACIVLDLDEEDYHDINDTWRHAGFSPEFWGYDGGESWLIPILRLASTKEEDLFDYDTEAYATFREMVSKLEWANQIYGFSWITTLTYTLGDKKRDDLKEYPVLNVVSLRMANSVDPAVHCGMVIFDLESIMDGKRLRPDAAKWFDAWDGKRPKVAVVSYQPKVGQRLWAIEAGADYPDDWPTFDEVQTLCSATVQEIKRISGTIVNVLVALRWKNPNTDKWSPYEGWPLLPDLPWSEEWAFPSPGMLDWLRRKYRLFGHGRAGIFVGSGEQHQEVAQRAAMNFYDRDEFFEISTLQDLGLPDGEDSV